MRQIDARHHIEAEPCQYLRDGIRVIFGVFQDRHVFINRIADHQRDALGGMSRVKPTRTKGQENKHVCC